MSAALDHLAARVASDPFFLAFALAVYQERHQLDDAALAALLGCDADTLTVLRLCRRPGGSPQFTADEDLAVLAERFRVDAEALRGVVSAAEK